MIIAPSDLAYHNGIYTIKLSNDKQIVLPGEGFTPSHYIFSGDNQSNRHELVVDPDYTNFKTWEKNTWVNDLLGEINQKSSRIESSHVNHFTSYANSLVNGSFSAFPTSLNKNAGWLDSVTGHWLSDMGYAYFDKFRLIPRNFNPKVHQMRTELSTNREVLEISGSDLNIVLDKESGDFNGTPKPLYSSGYVWNDGYIKNIKGNNNRIVIDFRKEVNHVFAVQDTGVQENYSMFNINGTGNLIVVNVMANLIIKSGWHASDNHHAMFSSVDVRSFGRHTYIQNNNMYVINIQPGCKFKFVSHENGSRIFMFLRRQGETCTILSFGDGSMGQHHHYRA